MITLYSTEGCHLCEMAYDLLKQAGVTSHVEIIDIAFDEELFQRYGVTIPVISVSESGESELGWPFDLPQLQQWLDKHGINHHS
ncbi:glutaredoxin family protein [Vibrio nigripulchritudo]|uniref:glutaredoxin family protein n=1 Tax=Vibrio nigripulchritudo TaxID=28173 RepID=UPI0009BBB4F2|nr:glutaredoxin family protein [Vibrio nigripulchritudo]BDU37121.1 thioredoxin family protein [Vibrio nigripulchritudo]BDU42833.1 thioredoxin family protein [Vibrio nigripulchritudo]